MASLTINIEPELLEAAKAEAERRHTSVDQLVTDSLSAAVPKRHDEKRIRAFIELMNSGPLGHIDRPLTREEIYAERTWPRS
ncbi:MAG TPA: hypothetical protein VII58_01480 [Acidobacteriaceae bacterium]